MPTEHATFGSSTAKRTNNCPAWVELSAGVPRFESKAAADGTIVHSLVESFLLNEGAEIPEGTSPEHEELAEELYVAIQRTMAKYSVTEYEPEVRGTVAEDVFGTIDFVGLAGDTVIIGDVKSGRGLQVEAENNDQILFAAWAAMNNSNVQHELRDCHQFVGVIWQPSRDGEIQTKEWMFSPAQAVEWGDNHQAQIHKARVNMSPIAQKVPPNPGDWCAFCPAAFKCPAKTGAALEALQFKIDDLAKIAWAMDRVDELQAWCNDVEKAAYNALEVGQPVPGWKLVTKRASRKWKDEKAAIAALRRPLGGVKQITTQKLLGIGAIEKMIKAAELSITLDDLTIAESSGTTLAPESDKREAVLSTTAFAAALASIQ
jgi:hypothetical protein